jgi:hypothetical protein
MQVYEIELRICDGCIRGEGSECHTPGCAYWMADTPGLDHRVFLASHIVGTAWRDDRQPPERTNDIEKALRKLLSAPRDHMSACDRIMGATHPCSCGANDARQVLAEVEAMEIIK